MISTDFREAAGRLGPPWYYVVSLLNGVVYSVLGWAIFRGYRWSRWAYAIYLPAQYASLGLIVGPMERNYIALAFYVVLVVLLFRRVATLYFRGGASGLSPNTGVQPGNGREGRG